MNVLLYSSLQGYKMLRTDKVQHLSLTQYEHQADPKKDFDEVASSKLRKYNQVQ